MPLSADHRRAPRRLYMAVAVLIAAGYGLTLAIFYPGIMTYDAKFIYEDIAKGVLGDWQSPVMTVLWGAIDPIAPSGSMFLLMATLTGGFCWLSRGKPPDPPVRALAAVAGSAGLRSAESSGKIALLRPGCRPPIVRCRRRWRGTFCLVKVLRFMPVVACCVQCALTAHPSLALTLPGRHRCPGSARRSCSSRRWWDFSRWCKSCITARSARRDSIRCSRSWYSTSAASATSPGRTSFQSPGASLRARCC